jgi:hypothetical protein
MAHVLYKGIEWRRRFTLVDNDTGARTDLTGKTIVFELRRRSGESTLVSLAVGSGITLLTQSGNTLGQADLAIPAGSSNALEAASHVYTMKVDGQVVLEPTKLPVRSL